MAAATTTALLGAGMAGYQMYQGAKAQRQGQKALQDYNRQDLTDNNPYEAIPISTVGSDIMREETQRTSANAVDAIRNMGPRGAALLPGVIGANNNANREARNYLDDQVTKRNYAIAGDNATTRGMMEDRENADLAGIGNQIQVGRQDMWSGFRGMGNTAMYAANNIDWNGGGNDAVDPLSGKITPAGVVPYRSPLPKASQIDYSKLYKTGF
jgi:hypothetical protein